VLAGILLLAVGITVTDALLVRDGAVVQADKTPYRRVEGLATIRYEIHLGADTRQLMDRLKNRIVPALNSVYNITMVSPFFRDTVSRRLTSVDRLINLITTEACAPFVGKTRHKRGLIDGGGYILKAVFGLETVDEVKKITESIKTKTIINNRHILQLRDKVNELTAGTNALARHIRQLETALDDTRQVIALELEIETVTRQLTNLRDYCVELRDRQDHASQGKIYSDWINRSDITMEILQTAQEWQMTPLINITQDWQETLKKMDIYTTVGTNTVSYEIHIPFGRDVNFTKYRVDGFPMLDNNTGEFHEVTLTNEIIYIGNGTHWGKATLCRRGLCFHPVVEKTDTCTVQLIQNRDPTLCTYRIVDKNTKAVELGKILGIFNPRNKTVTTACRIAGGIKTVVQNTVAVWVPKHCSVDMDEVHYSMRTASKNLTREVATSGWEDIILTKHNRTRKTTIPKISQLELEKFVTGDNLREQTIGWGAALTGSVLVLVIGVIVGYRATRVRQTGRDTNSGVEMTTVRAINEDVDQGDGEGSVTVDSGAAYIMWGIAERLEQRIAAVEELVG